MLTLALLTLAVTAHAQSNAVGKIEHLEDSTGATAVEIRNQQGSTAAGLGENIFANDHVVTTASQSVSIVLNDKSEIVVGPSSDLAVKEVLNAGGSTTLSFLHGLLHAAVNKVYANDSQFLIETPSAVMGVRGTEFVAEHDADGRHSTVHTIEGAVALGKTREHLRDSTRHELVSAGSMSRIQHDQERPQPAKAFEHASLMQRLAQKHPGFVKHLEQRRAVWRQWRAKTMQKLQFTPPAARPAQQPAHAQTPQSAQVRTAEPARTSPAPQQTQGSNRKKARKKRGRHER